MRAYTEIDNLYDNSAVFLLAAEKPGQKPSLKLLCRLLILPCPVTDELNRKTKSKGKGHYFPHRLAFCERNDHHNEAK